jgi:hypothetical protein
MIDGSCCKYYLERERGEFDYPSHTRWLNTPEQAICVRKWLFGGTDARLRLFLARS